MKPDKEQINQRVEAFQEACRTGGIRLTHQRLEIFREVARAGDHPDADTVHRRVRRRIPNVSLDTVYRTLWLLTDLDFITTLGPSRERSRFDANLDPHHHFICSSCGLTRDFYSEDLIRLKLPESAKAFGEIKSTRVEVRGFCLKCSAKAGKSGKS